MNYVEKIKLKPDKELEERLELLCDCKRFIYNFILSLNIKYYEENKKKPTLRIIYEGMKQYRALVRSGSVFDRNGELYSEEFQLILKSVPSQIPEMVCQDLHRAWKTLRKRRVPSYKSFHDTEQSFTIQRKTDSTFKLENVTLRVRNLSFKLPENKIRFIKEASDVKRITITKSNYGWHLSILTEISPSTFILEESKNKVGIDWGVSTFASDSNGNQYKYSQDESYENYVRLSGRLKVLQRRLSKKRNNNSEWRKSNRYKKLKLKVSWCYEKLANIRKNFLHKISKMYMNENQVIVIEDLKISNMLKNRKLARSISESMFYTWKVMLQYKAKFYGREVILVDPRNTSQTCSSCNEVLKEKLTLSKRVFKCESCNHEQDRDVNAAMNILNKGLIVT